MGVGPGLYMYDVVVKKVQVRYLIPDEFLSCMTASNLTKITVTPQWSRTMFVVARIDAFSVLV